MKLSILDLALVIMSLILSGRSFLFLFLYYFKKTAIGDTRNCIFFSGKTYKKL